MIRSINKRVIELHPCLAPPSPADFFWGLLENTGAGRIRFAPLGEIRKQHASFAESISNHARVASRSREGMTHRVDPCRPPREQTSAMA
jgi:hypothetical protein